MTGYYLPRQPARAKRNTERYKVSADRVVLSALVRRDGETGTGDVCANGQEYSKDTRPSRCCSLRRSREILEIMGVYEEVTTKTAGGTSPYSIRTLLKWVWCRFWSLWSRLVL